MDTPFNIIVDSRNAYEGHGSKLSFSLPGVTQVPANLLLLCQPGVSDKFFLSVGTDVGSKTHYFYWFERLTGNATVFNRAPLLEHNYDSGSVATALQTQMNAASWCGGDLYTVSYNQTKHDDYINS